MMHVLFCTSVGPNAAQWVQLKEAANANENSMIRVTAGLFGWPQTSGMSRCGCKVHACWISPVREMCTQALCSSDDLYLVS
jgi:hypothetical protein